MTFLSPLLPFSRGRFDSFPQFLRPATRARIEGRIEGSYKWYTFRFVDVLSSPNHTANDMQLIPTEKLFSNRESIRKAREAFLKGRTIGPDGLNIREETY